MKEKKQMIIGAVMLISGLILSGYFLIQQTSWVGVKVKDVEFGYASSNDLYVFIITLILVLGGLGIFLYRLYKKSKK